MINHFFTRLALFIAAPEAWLKPLFERLVPTRAQLRSDAGLATIEVVILIASLAAIAVIAVGVIGTKVTGWTDKIPG